MHATELIRLAGVHEFIEERGIGAINLIRRFAEQASLDSRFNYRLPITSLCHIYLPFRSISYSLRVFSFYFFFFSTTTTVKLEFCFGEWFVQVVSIRRKKKERKKRSGSGRFAPYNILEIIWIVIEYKVWMKLFERNSNSLSLYIYGVIFFSFCRNIIFKIENDRSFSMLSL